MMARSTLFSLRPFAARPSDPQARCKAALDLLGEEVANSYVELSADMVAWGQFLDRNPNDRQTGIYGTAAAAEILALAGYPATNHVVVRSQRAITTWFPDSNLRYIGKGDFNVTYKVASYLNSVSPGSDLPDPHPHAQWLVKSQLRPMGWGYYYNSDAERDNTSRILPTGRALIALRRYRGYLHTDAAREVLRWLLQQAAGEAPVDPAVRAVALYAVVTFPDAPNLVGQEFSGLASRSCQKLLSFADSWSGELTLHADYYPVRHQGQDVTRYMHTAREVAVALALYAADCRAGRRFVTEAALEAASAILDHKGILLQGRRFTKQQLWGARLLAAVADAPDAWFEPSDLRWIRQHPVATDLVMLATLGIVSIPGVMWTIDDLPDSGLARTLRVVGAIVSVVLLGLATLPATRLLRRTLERAI